MKNTWLKLTAATLMAGGMVLVSAQQSPSQPAQPTPRQQRFHRRAMRIAQYLNMSPAQVAAAKADFQAARQLGQPIRQQLKQLRAQMLQAVHANDTATINQLSAQEGGLRGQLMAIRDTTLAKIYAGLSPEQQAKANQLPAYIKQMRQQRMQNRSNG